MVNMDAFASAFGFASKSENTWYTLGKVTAVNGSTASVLLPGNATATEVESYCTASIGDIVLIIVKDGTPRAIARRGGDGSGYFLPLTGGTLTDTENIMKTTAVDGTPPASDQFGPGLAFVDKNGLGIGYLRHRWMANGDEGLQLGAQRYIGGNRKWNETNVGVDDAGNPFVSFSTGAAAAWRKGLGIYSWGELSDTTGNITLSTSWQKVPLKTFDGAGCESSSNGIKVGSTGLYVVSGQVRFSTPFVVNDLVHVGVFVGSSVKSDACRRIMYAASWETLEVAPRVLSLSANNVVTLQAYNEGGARGTVVTNYPDSTYLTLYQIA